MSAHGHFIETCSCGVVLSQCRCPTFDKERRVRAGPCHHRQDAGGAPSPPISAEKPLPCPFVWDHVGLDDPPHVEMIGTRFFYICQCGLRGPARDSTALALDAWNRRAPSPSPAGEAAEAVFQEPGDGKCLQACIATLLGLRLSDVPDYDKGLKGYETDFLSQRAQMNAWLEREHGVTLVLVDGLKGDFQVSDPRALFIASGPSPRRKGAGHACLVDIEGRIVHDPHPDGTGFGGKDPYEIEALCVLSKFRAQGGATNQQAGGAGSDKPERLTGKLAEGDAPLKPHNQRPPAAAPPAPLSPAAGEAAWIADTLMLHAHVHPDGAMRAETRDLSRRVRLLGQQLDEAVWLLRDVEWTGMRILGTTGYGSCPACGGLNPLADVPVPEIKDHRPGCRLAAFLSRAAGGSDAG